MTANNGRTRRAPNWTRALLVPWLALATAGCESLLEVDNPNNVPGDSIRAASAASAVVNGALSTLARGVDAVTLVYSTATDELDWVGSRDAWRQLDFGDVSDPFNEFSDAAFPFLAEGRWLSDEAIEILEAHQAAGLLASRTVNPILLVRAYLYGAIAYITIADQFDDWAFSDLRTSVAPVGEANMGGLYDKAVTYLDKGLTIATAEGAAGAPWRLAILATRARAKHAKAVWGLVGRRPISTANNGLVTDAGAVADANAAIALLSGPNWKFRFAYSLTTVGSDMGAWIDQRQEMRIGDAYIVPTANNLRVASVKLVDPITNAVDPELTSAVNTFIAGGRYPGYTVVSAREMHLILAEAALAVGDTPGFTTAINNLRGLDSKTAYSGQIPAVDLLRHERRVNLFMQGRRLADHYRFGIAAAKWQPTSEAVTQPGRFLPIAARECLSNESIGAQNCRK